MNRRDYLGSLAVGGTTALLTGCLGSLGGHSSPHTYLGKPDGQRADSADLPYPAWGQALPEVTLTAPLSNETVTTTAFEGKRNVMLACFYTHCPNVCQQMIGQMRNVQADAIQNGYADQVEFLGITFDPERDTPDRLEEYASEMRISLDAGNWEFLRPKSVERARAVVTDGFGIKFQKTDKNGDPVGTDTGTGNGAGTETGTENGTRTGTGDHRGSGEYFFTHLGLVFLANVDGYVERAYRFAQSGNPPWQDRRDDLKKLVRREG